MHIWQLEQIFSIHKVVPIDLFLVFWQTLLLCYLYRCVFCRSHKFPYRSLPLSTTVLNDIQDTAREDIIYIYTFVELVEYY